MAKLVKASFPITKKIWFNGKLVDWAKAQIHVLAHALHYGSGVFEGIRFYENSAGQPVIFRLTEHVERLIFSGKALGMQIPYSARELEKAIIQTVKANKVKSGYIRPIAFFGYGKMGLSPIGAPVDVAVACWPWGSYLGGQPIKVQTSKWIRIHPKSLVTEAKVCGHYVNSILASLEMRQAKCDEALLLDYRGFVAEGPGENVFFVKKGVLHTPKDGSILQSITRDSVIKLAADLKLKVVRGDYKLAQLYAADEAFFVGTAAEVQPIGILDGRKIGGTGRAGPITSQLRANYLALVAGGGAAKYAKWLTVVK